MKNVLLAVLVALGLQTQAQCQADFSYMQNGPTTIFTELSTINPVWSTNYSVSWQWDFGDGNTSTLQNPTHTYSNGIYTPCLTVTYFDSTIINYCISVYCDSILVGNAQPCSLTGTSVTMDSLNNSLEATWGPNFTYDWSNPSSSTTQSVPYYPNWCVHIVDTNGCDTTICETPFPCAIPFLHVLHDTTNNILEANQVSSNFTYHWLDTNGVIIGTNHFIAYYPNWCLYVVDTSGCDTTICNSAGPCQVEINGDSIICSWGSPQVLTAVPIGNGTPPYTYLWSNGQSNNPLLTIIGPGTYCVTLTDANGCMATACINVSVQDIPIYSVPAPPTICYGDSIVLEIDTFGLSNITWVPNTLLTPPVHRIVDFPAFSHPYIVEAIDSLGCDRRGEIFVIVDSCNTAPCQVEIDGDSIICNWGDSILLEASPTASSTPFVSYVWSTGTTGHILSTTANFPGVYSVIATDSTGCVSTASFTVAVEEIVIYSTPSPAHICLGDSIVMWLNPVLPINNIIWVPTGDTTHAIVEFPTGSTTYVVEALDANGCERRGEIFVIVDSCNTGPCQAMFYSSLGFQPNTIEFFDGSTPTGNITSWHWDFGDGTTSNQQNPIHTYLINVPSVFYTVCLTITAVSPNGGFCTSTYCDSIYLQNMNNCQASFYYADLGNNTAHFTNTSMPMMPPPGHIIEFDLDYGDGTIDYNIGTSTTHAYSSLGTYYACLTMWVADSNGTVICTDTYCDSVTVTSGGTPCQANFTYIQDSIVITNPNGTIFVGLGNLFYFIDLSMPIGMISTWSWDMGDFGAGAYHQGTSSSSQFPVYEYDTSGTYNACLTITTTIGGQTCTSTYCDTILAYPSPPPTGIIAYDFIKEFNIYPNPANDKLAIDMQIAESGTMQINFINMMGQKVNEHQVSIVNGQTKLITDVSQLPNGVYTIEFVVNNSKLHKRVIISR